MNIVEVILFVLAVVGVIALGIWKSRDEDLKGKQGASDYFLAGRGLNWWLIGLSLIAANISTEQFVGMSGSAANWLGMAIASYEWISSITLVIVAFWFLPRFLKAGLYTIPEFLEYRFNSTARLAMSIPAVLTLVFVTTSSVIYSGAKFVSAYYNTVPVLNNLHAMCWTIAILAALYVFMGGLKACAWTDLVWGTALIASGMIIMGLAFHCLATKSATELIQTKVPGSSATVTQIEEAGVWERFVLLNEGLSERADVDDSSSKLHMIRPKEDPELPWTALVLGLWIPAFFYWGLNQFIVQRTLGAKSLAEGQKGIVFAAFLKLLIPFLVVVPGILAFNLFNSDLLNSTTGTYDYDRAFPVLVRNLVKPMPLVSWFVLAALCGAVISSLASMLNSASTLATMDFYAKFTKEQDSARLVRVGRLLVIVFVVLAALVAPQLDRFDSIFAFIQEFQGFISPGILAVFIFGFFFPRTPRSFGTLGIVVNVVAYGFIKWIAGPFVVAQGWWYSDQIAFLDRMGICLVIVVVIGLLVTWIKPMKEPVKMPVNNQIDITTSPVAKLFGLGVVVLTLILYAIFW